MPSFVQTFGGTNIYPSDVSYRAISLSASTTLEWPTEVATGTNVAASIMDVTAASVGLTIRMPPADETSVGQTALFFNPGANAFTVADNSGAVITVVAAGESWQVYITDNTTAAGVWRTVEYGAGTSAPAAGALAGKGIKAITTTLNQSMPVFSYPIIPGTYSYTLDDALRAGAVLWDSGSTGTLTLAAASTNGSDWFCHIRNNGAGSVVLNCTGGDQVNGLSSLTFGPGDSATLICDGSDYFTIGQGNASTSGILAFDYVALDLTGAASPYVLQGVELNRVSYNFIGALTSNIEIVVPLNLQQYWVRNSTSGPHSLIVRTASGSGVQVQQGYSQILYCNGVNVVAANDPPGVTDIPVSAGGIYVDTFSGNGATQIFNLSYAVVNEDRTQVYISGIYQQKDSYSVSGSTLTFLTPPPLGSNNIEVVALGAANYAASSVLFTPTGTISSTNVQDAIAEVSGDLASSAGSSLVGYIAPGGGAVARTTQSRLRDYISVKDYGAVGNGSTDDTAAINAAIAALSGRNSIGLFFPEGVYKVTSSINVNRGQISLIGAGMSATVIRCHADGVNVFNVRSTPPAATSGVVISDMQIDIGGGVSTTTGAGIYLERVANAIIDNVSLGSHASCIQIMGCFNIVTSNIIISYAAGSPGGRNGVYVSRSTPTYSSVQSGNIFINNMTATGGGQPLDTVTPGAAYGILFDSVDGLWVNNSYFGYFDQSSACGSLIGYDITGIKFDNTWLDASRNFCLWLKGSGGAIGLHEFVGLRMVGGPFCTYNAYIEGAWGDIHFNGGHAEQAISHNIAVTSSGGNIIFDGFDCVGSALRTAQSCMYFDGPDYVRIVGCTINGNSTTATLHGFYINDGTGHVVVGNTITNCAIAGLFDGSADYWTATDNMDAAITNTFAITNSASGTNFYLMNIGRRSTGWGTPTGAAKIANFPGGTATLTQCSQTISQILTELKAVGLLVG